MKFKTQKFLGALAVCGCLAALRTQASFEYDWTDSSSPGLSVSILLDASSHPLLEGSILDIVSLNIVANGITYTKANIVSVGPFFEWDASTINAMSLQLTTADLTIPVLSVQDSTINGGGLTRVVSGTWSAPSVPDAANTGLLFVIALGSLGVWHWLRRSRSVTVS